MRKEDIWHLYISFLPPVFKSAGDGSTAIQWRHGLTHGWPVDLLFRGVHLFLGEEMT